MPVIRIQNVWTNFVGAPGYTNLHFSKAAPTVTDVTAAAGACRTFFNGLVSFLPTGVTITQSGLASIFSDFGIKTGEIGYTPSSPSVGTSTTAYAGATGAVIQWKTGQWINGRQLSGRTFVVPLAGGYATDGTLAPTASTALTASALNLRSVTGLPLVVFSPPRNGNPVQLATVTAHTVPDRTATLRSRR